MPVYIWKGRTRQGNIKKGEIEASNEACFLDQILRADHGPDTDAEISVVADRRVGAGGCVVETPDFIVDGTIGAQIDTARKTIRGGDL